MFVAREKELRILHEAFAGKGRSAVLVYGKRRVGKSALIAEAARDFDGIVVNHLCVQSTYEGNLQLLGRSVCLSMGLPVMQFASVMDLFGFLNRQERRVLVILDEYQYFKDSGKRHEVDSYMQTVIDTLSDHVKIVLCGSYIAVMRELMEEDNPLFGRFTSIIHLEEMDYLDASMFYPEVDHWKKIGFYAVFGGSPYVLSIIDPAVSIRENVCRFLLTETSLLRIYIENIMLREIQKAYDVRILEIIGNGKKRYSDIRSGLSGSDNGLLDKQLKNLLGMETITKIVPINKPGDKKKQFYSIKDNLLRFYFSFIFANTSQISRLGEDAFYEQYIRPSVETFISHRFEDIACQFFARQVRTGRIKGVYDIGTYWFDDPANKRNGEFDCVLKKKDVYDFYECKYYRSPMTEGECEREALQVRNISGMNSGTIGFICTGGFDFDSVQYQLIHGKELFENGQEDA